MKLFAELFLCCIDKSYTKNILLLWNFTVDDYDISDIVLKYK